MATAWYSWNSQVFHFDSYGTRAGLWPQCGTPATLRYSTLRVTIPMQFYGYHMVLLEQSGIPLWVLPYPHMSMATTWYSWNSQVFHFECYRTHTCLWPPHGTPGTVRYSTTWYHMVLLEQSGIPLWVLPHPRMSMATIWYSWNSQVFHVESYRTPRMSMATTWYSWNS